MTTYIIFNKSTKFQLNKGVASEAAVEALILKHVDDYDLTLEINGDTDEYVLCFDGGEVGNSFPHRVRALVAALGEHVTGPFMIQLRIDSMSDERDTEIFGGPSNEAIAQFSEAYYLKEAMDLLGGNRYQNALRMKDQIHEVMCEASEILGELTEKTAPPSMRWPIVDELRGYALIFGDAKTATPKNEPAKLAEVPGEVLGSPHPDWPEWCKTFEERKAYQQGVADARTADKQLLPEALAWKWAYEYLQDRMISIDRHGWAHDCDDEIQFRIKNAIVQTTSTSQPPQESPERHRA